LLVALVATIVCLPLLGLQLLDGGPQSSEAAVVSTDGGQPSMVMAVVPSTTVAPTTAAAVVADTATAEPTTPSTARPSTTAPTTAPLPTTSAAPPTTAAPPPPPPAPAVSTGSDWDRLAQCESGGNWAMNTGNGYSGGIQFHPDTWTRHGGGEFAAMAFQASREQQIVVGERIRARQGWSAWPGCARKLGLL